MFEMRRELWVPGAMARWGLAADESLFLSVLARFFGCLTGGF